MEHPYIAFLDMDPYPPAQINDPPQKVKGLWVGVCVYCGGWLGGAYQEDLYHMECDDKAEAAYFSTLIEKVS